MESLQRAGVAHSSSTTSVVSRPALPLSWPTARAPRCCTAFLTRSTRQSQEHVLSFSAPRPARVASSSRVHHRKTCRRRAASPQYSPPDTDAPLQQQELDSRILWLLLPAMASVFLDPLMALCDTGAFVCQQLLNNRHLRQATQTGSFCTWSLARSRSNKWILLHTSGLHGVVKLSQVNSAVIG